MNISKCTYSQKKKSALLQKILSFWLKNLAHPAYLCPLGSEPLNFLQYIFKKNAGIFIKCHSIFYCCIGWVIHWKYHDIVGSEPRVTRKDTTCKTINDCVKIFFG